MHARGRARLSGAGSAPGSDAAGSQERSRFSSGARVSWRLADPGGQTRNRRPGLRCRSRVMMRSVLAVLAGLVVLLAASFAIEWVTNPLLLRMFPEALPNEAALNR